MFSTIYVEQAVVDSPRVQNIIARFPAVPVVCCQRYGEIFNRSAQNFRLQKKAPALILARKHGKLVLPAPAGYGFEGGASYYFSHMLNCLYDCRYCFLQGMYRSANYVLFVNYEDFTEQLHSSIQGSAGPSIYYSGYDCDSLALEPVTGFCEYFMPLFRSNPAATLELRTKSTQVRYLLQNEPMANCVVAMSFSAEETAQRWERGVPSMDKRIEALQKLQRAGWPVAIRFEPIIASANTFEQHKQLFERVFASLDVAKIHSVSTGEFRVPADYYKKMVQLYPDQELFARAMISSDGIMSLRDNDVETMHKIEQQLLGFISPTQYYRCA